MRRSRRLVSLLTLLTAFTFVAAACGDDSGSSSATTGGGAATTGGGAATTAGGAATTGASGEALPACGGTKDVKGSADNTLETRTLTQASGVNNKIGMMYDITGRGDKSFNDSAGAGLDKAKADFGIAATESTPTGDADRATASPCWRARATASSSASASSGATRSPPVANGEHRASTSPSSTRSSTLPTCVSMTFAEEQGSFLVGAAAAMKSKTGNIGFIGGVENDLIKKFEAGYTAGAKQINPDITVDVKYISQPPDFTGFNDPAKGKEIAAAMYEGGADVVYPPPVARVWACSRPPRSTPTRTSTQVWAIGVDSDQIPDGRRRPPAVHPDVDAEAGRRRRVQHDRRLPRGQGQGGHRPVFDLKVDGVGYSTTGGNLEDITSKLDDLKQQIIDGKITVPTAALEQTSRM